MEFAFFAANFGYSHADYQSLTQTQKALILRARETAVVEMTGLLRDVVLNAIGSSRLKRGRKAKPFWKRKGKRLSKKEMKSLRGKFAAIEAGYRGGGAKEDG